jgi:hypothetical protein
MITGNKNKMNGIVKFFDTWTNVKKSKIVRRNAFNTLRLFSEDDLKQEANKRGYILEKVSDQFVLKLGN